MGSNDFAQRKAKSRLKSLLDFILHQWLLIGICISCLLAYLFPKVASQGGIIRAEYTILYGVVAIIFLISGMSIPREKLITHILNWRLHILVQGMSFLFIPALMYALVRLIDVADTHGRIDKGVLAGYIVLACLPTTISSNVVMTRSAGGDDAAALVEVLIGNVMGPFVTPGWATVLFPKIKDFNQFRESNNDMGDMYRHVFQQLGLSVLVPLFVGQLIRWMWSEKSAWVLQKFKLNKVNSFCLILLVWTAFSTCFETKALLALTTNTVILVVFFNIGLYLFLTLICFTLARPPSVIVPRKRCLNRIIHQVPPGETIAICFCGAAKTTGLGIPLLYSMYATGDMFMKAQMSVPIILYTTEQVFCAHFMVYVLKHWMRRIADKKERSDRSDSEDRVTGDRAEEQDGNTLENGHHKEEQ